MRLRALKPSDPSLCLQCKGPHYSPEHRQRFLQGMQAPPSSWGQQCGGWVGAGGGGGRGTPQQIAPVCCADGLGLLLDGGADQEGEDEPVSLEQTATHLQTQHVFVLWAVLYSLCLQHRMCIKPWAPHLSEFPCMT